MKRKLLFILIAVVVVFAALQLIPVNRTDPPVSREVNWDSPQTRALVKRACFDCHSNETAWPWYTGIAPSSFYVANHVAEGRQRLNFSAWDQPNSDFEEAQRSINNGQMPLWDYVLIHPDASLSATEKAQLISGLQATFQQDPPIARRRGFGGGG
jgi:hypothetical protein